MKYSTLPTTRLRAVENSVLMLMNDMQTVTEARCLVHGVGGGTTANAAAALLPCIGIEIVATRTRPAGEGSNDAGLRRVFSELAAVTGYDPYRTLGLPVFKMIRNGIAHGFYPSSFELANGPRCSATVSFWIDGKTQRSICVDTLGDRAQSGHLVLKTAGSSSRAVWVSLQHWYCDVRDYLDHFRARLAADASLQGLVEANDLKLEQDAESMLVRQVGETDSIALGL